MQQPEFGLQIAQLRQQRGWTQEELAAECRVNVRSIQRIEAGEVLPRRSTLNQLTEILGMNATLEASQEDRFWLLLLHLSSFIPIVVVALFIWGWRKDEDPVINVTGSMC